MTQNSTDDYSDNQMTQLTIDDVIAQIKATEDRELETMADLAIDNKALSVSLADEIRKAQNMIELCLKEIKATQKLLDTLIADELK